MTTSAALLSLADRVGVPAMSDTPKAGVKPPAKTMDETYNPMLDSDAEAA
jgi:hypothetical protein